MEENSFIFIIKFNKILLNNNKNEENCELNENEKISSTFSNLLKYFKLDYFGNMVYSYFERYHLKEAGNHICVLEQRSILEYLKDKISVKNVSIFYNLAKLYNLPSLAEITFSYIQRCFTMVVETKSFLELDYTLIAKILESSGLYITSELEVYNAAENWLIYDTEERCKFSNKMLLKVRLSLLSDRTLKCLLNKSSSFFNNYKCITTIKEALNKKENSFQNKTHFYTSHRYCNQNKFSILTCGGRKTNQTPNGTVMQIDEKNFKNLKVLPSNLDVRSRSKAVCVKGEVYIFGGFTGFGGFGFHSDLVSSVEKYSPSIGTWNRVAEMYDDRIGFCACAFMDKIFIIAGKYYNKRITNYCNQFDTKDYTWKEIAGMKEAREYAACAVFEGRIVVSGGTPNNMNALRSVESYDVDEWSSMPSTIEERSYHSLVVVKNKLFVIGSEIEPTCEVYDGVYQKFVAFKLPALEYDLKFNHVVSVGSNFFILQLNKLSVLIYDVEQCEWHEESYDLPLKCVNYSCVKFPMY